jgi:hypothetical protein
MNQLGGRYLEDFAVGQTFEAVLVHVVNLVVLRRKDIRQD